jgi:peroxiredoxin
VRDAITVARNLVEQPRDPQKNGPNDGGSAQRSGRARWVELLTRYELWDDLIEATNSGAIDWSNIPLEQQQKAYTLGLAHAAKNDQAKLVEQIGFLKKQTGNETKPLVAELEGLELLARGEIGPAFEQFAKATLMRPEALARAHLAARNYGFAESTARQGVEKNANQVSALAAQVEVLHACGKEKEARDAYRSLASLARCADRDLPVFRRLESVVARWKAEGSWSETGLPANANGTDEAVVGRIDVKTLGPLVWSPFEAPLIAGTDTSGASWNLTGLKGKNVLVLFFLGGKCAHCMQQLELFGKEHEALKKLNVETIAISTDDIDAARSLKNNKDGIKFPMSFLADPRLELFKRYRAFDDFENQPLHGTFLIDGQGNIRFQRISADPFLDVEFIKAEVGRINRLLKR